MLPCERLRAFELADRLAHAVYDATESWPRSELYRLVRQARRAAFSVAANICEGASKRGSREYARFLNISVGSLSELTYALRFARQRRWIDEATENRLESIREMAAKAIWALYLSVQRASRKP